MISYTDQETSELFDIIHWISHVESARELSTENGIKTIIEYEQKGMYYPDESLVPFVEILRLATNGILRRSGIATNDELKYLYEVIIPSQEFLDHDGEFNSMIQC